MKKMLQLRVIIALLGALSVLFIIGMVWLQASMVSDRYFQDAPEYLNPADPVTKRIQRPLTEEAQTSVVTSESFPAETKCIIYPTAGVGAYYIQPGPCPVKDGESCTVGQGGMSERSVEGERSFVCNEPGYWHLIPPPSFID